MTLECIDVRLRAAISKVVHADIRQLNGFMESITPVDCITGILAFNMACDSPDDFKNLMIEQASLLKPGGTFLTAIVCNSSCFKVNGETIHYPRISFPWILECLNNAGFNNVAYSIFPARPNISGETRSYLFVSAKLLE